MIYPGHEMLAIELLCLYNVELHLIEHTFDSNIAMLTPRTHVYT